MCSSVTSHRASIVHMIYQDQLEPFLRTSLRDTSRCSHSESQQQVSHGDVTVGINYFWLPILIRHPSEDHNSTFTVYKKVQHLSWCQLGTIYPTKTKLTTMQPMWDPMAVNNWTAGSGRLNLNPRLTVHQTENTGPSVVSWSWDSHNHYVIWRGKSTQNKNLW